MKSVSKGKEIKSKSPAVVKKDVSAKAKSEIASPITIKKTRSSVSKEMAPTSTRNNQAVSPTSKKVTARTVSKPKEVKVKEESKERMKQSESM